MNRPSLSLRLPACVLAPLAALALGACKPAEPSSVAPPERGTAPAIAAPSPSSAVAAADDALNPLPDPKDAIKASMRKFMALERYHASMQLEGGPRGAMHNEIDFVAPNRYRMTMQGVGTQTVIGDTMYMDVGGRTMKMPLPAGTLTQWRDPVRLAENEASMTVQAQGLDRIDGQSARKYLVHHDKPQPVDVTIWIDSNDLPLQIRVAGNAEGHASVATIHYSHFNDPSIEVEPPQ